MPTRRGFTDHDHIDEVELIYMNGRVYDYNVGRFMRVDPIISIPGNSQGINPYSYIMNNPLVGTDPTGYALEILICRPDPSCYGKAP
ncbi:MAG: RHS repeat-associated protein [Alteromonadaceae bacterium]|jgi:RHS repeat-associated protein